MGNCFRRLCGSPGVVTSRQSASDHQSQSPSRCPDPAVTNPNSQVQVGDYKQRLENIIKDQTDLSSLIGRVEQLLSEIKKARSAQDLKASSIEVPNSVKDTVGWGSEFLETISKEGENLNKDISASKLPSEIKTAVSKGLEHVGYLHWVAVGFSVIAFVLHRMDQVSSNFSKCVQLLDKMVDLGKRLQALHNRMAGEHLNEAVHAIVEGVITCCCCMSQRKIFRYLFASTDEGNLKNIETAIDELQRALILMIAMDIQREIPRRYYPSDPQVPLDAVGIDGKINQVVELLDVQSKGPARAVLLYGFGGAGKTTLGDCVLKVVSGCMKYSRIELGIKQLHEDQQDLCADLTKENWDFKNYKEGQAKLKEVLEKEKAFIFIDNALSKSQIDNLLPSQLSLALGSRLLITSRTIDVIEELRSRGIDCKTVSVEGLSDEAAREYFRRTVVRSEEITSALERKVVKLSDIDAVAKECHGIPLLLKVYAQHLERRGSDPRVYDDMIRALQEGNLSHPNPELEGTLLYVYRQLPQASKEAFLDICMYFHGWNKVQVSYIVTTMVLNALVDGALVKIDASDKVVIHDVLKAMGMKQGHQTRVRSERDWENAPDLDNNKKMEGIWLLESEGTLKLESERLIATRDSLRILALGRNIQLTGECEVSFPKLTFLQIENLDALPILGRKLPEGLRYVKLRTTQFSSSVPSHRAWVNDIKDLRNLELFSFECSEIKMFPKEFRLPAFLRELHLKDCKALEELPRGFENLSNLTGLTVSGCESLIRLPEVLGNLGSLQSLRCLGCGGLTSLPEALGNLGSLQSLKLRGCGVLTSLPEALGNLGSLQSLDLWGCGGLTSLPEALGNLGSLQSLELRGCGGLTSLPEALGNIGSLKSLDLAGCGGLTSLPEALGNLGSLRSLYLEGCGGLTSLPEALGNLGSLRSLDLSGCAGLTSLPEALGNLGSLQSLDLRRCEGLTSLPEALGNLGSLRSLKLWGCGGLTSLPEALGNLGSLRSLYLSGCGGLTSLPEALGNLGSLQSLKLWGCGGLTSLPEALRNLGSLQSLDWDGEHSLNFVGWRGLSSPFERGSVAFAT